MVALWQSKIAKDKGGQSNKFIIAESTTEEANPKVLQSQKQQHKA